MSLRKPIAGVTSPSIRLLATSSALLGATAISYAVLGSRESIPVAAAMAAVLLASLLSSIAGFAFTPICGAILFHLLDDHVQVVQILITCSIANQVTMVWALRRVVDWRGISVFLVGGALGVPLGVWALLHADRHLYTRGLGIFLTVYGAYTLGCKPHMVRRQHLGLDLVAGFLGGITGGAAGFPSAPVMIWCGLKGWDKVRQRAVFQPFILIMQVAALFVINILKQEVDHSGTFEPSNLQYVPAGLFGTWFGLACFRRMSNRQFFFAINILLIVAGISYVL